jgi:diaminohydroxyphosphoribosylaminopyrimidine deaminase/5-amino-6-(5-phosphoribosylamino)uracil reductase
MSDLEFMRRAIAVALTNLGKTAPNPVVGCVIVRDGVILAQAATAPGGRPHAEEQALANIDARGATAYVTLEPCGARSSGTAPCSQRLVEAGVARVIYACEDPSPLASGQGSERLIAAGVAVERGLLSQEASDALRYDLWKGDVNARLP